MGKKSKQIKKLTKKLKKCKRDDAEMEALINSAQFDRGKTPANSSCEPQLTFDLDSSHLTNIKANHDDKV